jgi:hypothetical protein
MEFEACKHNITVQDILTHTSGLTYGFDPDGTINPVDGIYNREGFADMHGKSLKGRFK